MASQVVPSVRLAAERSDGSDARAIRRRLLMRIADADTSHWTLDADEGDWLPFVEGVRIKVLRETAEAQSYLLRLAPGAVIPAHRHPQDEECLVLEGWMRVGSGPELGPGAYHLAQGGSLHALIGSESGATIFLRGAVPESRHLLT